MLELVSASPGKDKGHHLVPERFSSFLLAKMFLECKYSFFTMPSLFVYARASLATEGKSVMPMSNPVSVYRHLGLLWSSLGEDMADADVASKLRYPRRNQTDGIRVTGRP